MSERVTPLHRDARFPWLYPWGLLALILVGAFAARAYNLDKFSFWVDELYHVVAAQSVVETGAPTLPSYRGAQYTRAYPVTYITALMFDWFGSGEAAGRAPFLALNMVFLLTAFCVTRRWFNVHLALIVTFVLAFSPHELRMGREVRMYGLLQLLYFSASALFFAGLEYRRPNGNPSSSSSRLPPVRGVVLLGSASVLFLLAYRIQPLAMNFALALAAYCLVMVPGVARGQGLRAALRSRYTLVLALMTVAGLCVLLGAPGFVSRLLVLAHDRPAWATTADGASYYSWFFSYYYSGLTAVYLLGIVLLIRRFGKPGVFVLCSFVPLMAAHAWIFTGKVEMRYVFYILPYFFIAACFALERVFRRLLRLVAVEWRRRSKAVATVLFVGAVSASSLFAWSWLRESRDLLRWGYGPNWKTVAPTLRQLRDECVVLSPWPLHVAYYSGEFPDYILRKKQREDGDAGVLRLGDRSVMVRWLFDPEEFERLVDRSQDVCVVMTDWAFNNDAYVGRPLREAITQRLVAVEHGGDAKVQLYRKRALAETDSR
jgi:hypothetical protein